MPSWASATMQLKHTLPFVLELCLICIFILLIEMNIQCIGGNKNFEFLVYQFICIYSDAIIF